VQADSTSANYTITAANLLIRDLTMSGAANWSRTKPKGERAGPVEETTLYTFNAAKSKPIPWNRRASGTLSYTYLLNVPDDRDTYDEHRLVFAASITF
jgi:hypothetical protein